MDFCFSRDANDEVEVGTLGGLQVRDRRNRLRVQNVAGEGRFDEARCAQRVADEAFNRGDVGTMINVGKDRIDGGHFHGIVVACAGAMGEDHVDVLGLKACHREGVLDRADEAVGMTVRGGHVGGI